MKKGAAARAPLFHGLVFILFQVFLAVDDVEARWQVSQDFAWRGIADLLDHCA